MSMIKCPECGQPVSTNAGTCPHCGIAISGHIFQCPACGAFNTENKLKCVVCGKDLEIPQPRAQEHEPQISTLTTAPDPKPKKKGNSIISCLIVLLILLGLIAGGYFWFAHNQQLQKEEREFTLLQNTTKPEYFQQFLEAYPDSKHYAEVKERMHQLEAEEEEWKQAIKANSKNLFKDFLAHHPVSYHARECEAKLDSLDWITAKEENTDEAVKKYMNDHPAGLFIDQATDLQAELAKTLVSQEERPLVIAVFESFCNALSHRDPALLAGIMLETMSNFNGKENAKPADIIAFAEAKMAPDVIGLHYLVGTPIDLQKELQKDGTINYVAAFKLEETINRSDAGQQQTNNTYQVESRLNAEKKIISMTIKQN